MRKALSAIVACATLSACSATPPPAIGVSHDIKNRIALCAGGYSSYIGAELEAKIGKDLQEGGKLTAGVKDDLQGAYMKMPMTEANAATAYQTYVGCVERPH